MTSAHDARASVLAVAMRRRAFLRVLAGVVALVERRVAGAGEVGSDGLAGLMAAAQLRRFPAGARDAGDVVGVLAAFLDLAVVADVAFVGHGRAPRLGD